MSALGRANHLHTVVDNTFASPWLQRPIEFGADYVVHSTTKYLGGHSDVIGGAVVARHAELLERVRFLQSARGAVPGPLDVYLVHRGLKTLAVRMERHCANAAALARLLSAQKKIRRVLYPGLIQHIECFKLRRDQKALTESRVLCKIDVQALDRRSRKLILIGKIKP